MRKHARRRRALPLLREWCHLPILVDPAHAAGIAPKHLISDHGTQFTDDGFLHITHVDEPVAFLDMEFLHEGDESATQPRKQDPGGHGGPCQHRLCEQPGQLAPLDLLKKKLHTQIVRPGVPRDHRACP